MINAADDDLEPETLYRIVPGGHGQWHVFEGGAGKLLSGFSTRDQAINCATALAGNKPRAVVEIYRADGELESSRAFHARETGAARAGVVPAHEGRRRQP